MIKNIVKQFVPPILYPSSIKNIFGSKTKENGIELKYEKCFYNKLSFINKAISMFDSNSCNYLEIGCDLNEVFNSIYLREENKVGVDPFRGGNMRMTSDEYFANHEKTFEVIHVDGLHEYEQCQKDIINALECLSGDGIIILDDLLPKSESQEYTPRKTNSFWSGDVWKVSVELMTSNNLNFCIANIFPGIGILKKGQNYSYNKMNEKLKNMRFNDFMKYYKELPIVDCETAFKFIEKKV
jgi:hypothetical protein